LPVLFSSSSSTRDGRASERTWHERAAYLTSNGNDIADGQYYHAVTPIANVPESESMRAIDVRNSRESSGANDMWSRVGDWRIDGISTDLFNSL